MKKRRSKEYNSWSHMKGRCLNPNNLRYSKYGAKGITVCERWLNFDNFLADMGIAPSPHHTLDRYPNKAGNYEPGNVRWATWVEQANNTKRNVVFEYDGQKKTVTEWEKHFGFKKRFIHNRLRLGWSFEKAVTTPTLNKVDNMRPFFKLKTGDGKAFYNGKKGGLSVRWMASMAGVSVSAVYRAINRNATEAE